MSRGPSRSDCIRTLESLAGSGVDVDVLRLEAVEVLRRAIGFELWGVPLVDPDTLIPSRAVVSDVPPWGPHLPLRWVWDQSLRDVNSRAKLAMGRDHVGILSAATHGDLARSRRWRDLGKPMGMGDELRAAIVDASGCWGSFELFRAREDPSFDDDDAELVRVAAQILGPAFRHGRMPSPPERRPRVPDQAGVVLIDKALRPRGMTESARAWFGLLGDGRNRERTPMPIHVYGVIGRLLAAEDGEDTHRRPRVRIWTSSGVWANVEAARVEDKARTIVVTMSRASPTDVLALIARAHALTRRERELVGLLLEDLDTRELGRRMSISPYTVKDHLKSIFEKLGVHTRRELVNGILGQAA